MVTLQNPLKTFAIATHPAQPEAADEARMLAGKLSKLGMQAVITATIYDPALQQHLENQAVDVLIGGDGTMLRAGHLAAPLDIPVLGINRGRFGFLMDVNQANCKSRFEQFIRGEYWLEKRMMLHCIHYRGEDKLGDWHVLNDVVISRGESVRPIQITASLDGYQLASYNADALIVSTATGSTAYALAAGGPILPPGLRNIMIVPVAPHLSLNRAIILEEDAKVTLTVNTNHQAVLSADGQAPESMNNDDHVAVFASKHAATFIRFEDPGYFYRNLSQYMERNPITGGTE